MKIKKNYDKAHLIITMKTFRCI